LIRLIGIDIDGTLLDSRGHLPDANREAIYEAVAAGIHVALVTGRSYPFARPVADTLPAALTLIVSSGAVERSMDGTVLARRLLDRRVAESVLAATLPYRDHAALIFDRDETNQIVFETMNWEHPGRKAYWLRNHHLIGQAVPLEDALVEDPIEVMFNGAAVAMRELADSLRRDPRGLSRRSPQAKADWAVSLTEYVHRDFSLIDVTAPTATKGHALAWRAGQLGLSRDEVMAVGDNFNDVEMLEYAGTPVLMANAVEGLRRPGWHVTGHQDADGLAQAIRELALGPRLS
jgi:hydroxymethylpyrimidine pyrophosphatase-like HAD family hydrolase